ncbi:MAG: beta-lactamase family protein, partial [Calditrichaeota bacterium]|nr:beta-lactamase family protein [Calditrichota bacterium]
MTGQIVVDTLIEDYLSQKIDEFYEKQRVASVSFSLFKGNLYRYNHAVGYADLESKRETSVHNKYVLASVSKTITASMILDLEDAGYFKLTDSISAFQSDLPSDINLIQLLTHTSGLVKLRNFGNYPQAADLGDVPEYVSKTPIHSRKKHRYNNMNYALLGSLASQVTATPFDSLIKAFYAKYSDPNSIDLLTNKSYDRDSLNVKYYLKKGWRRYPHEPYRSGMWEPAALITTSSYSLNEFLQSIMTPTFIEKIKRFKVPVRNKKLADGTQYEEFYGLGYRLGYRDGKLSYIYHNGFIYGALSTICYFPDYDIGFVALSNMSPYPKLNYSFGAHFIKKIKKA